MNLQTRCLVVGLFIPAFLPLGCTRAEKASGGPTPSIAPITQPAQSEQFERFEYAQVHMGLEVRLVVYAPSQAQAETACRAAYARVAELDQIMSDYRQSSELNQLCRKAGSGPVKVSPELFYVLKQAQEMARASDGAFDVTVGPLVRLWRTARRSGQLPSPRAIAEAKQRVGWEKMKLDEVDRTVTLRVAGMQLDLGGIAKGYAGDEALAVLRRHGITRAMFEAGGDIVLGDAPPEGMGKDPERPGWVLELISDRRDPAPPRAPLANCAVSTSGDTEQFVVIEGKRYSHVVDPRTGYGLTSRVLVNVIARSGIIADPLSKAIAMADDPTRQKLANRYGAEIRVRKAEDGAASPR